MRSKQLWKIGVGTAVVFACVSLFLHIPAVWSVLSLALRAVLPIPVGLCTAFVLNLWLRFLEKVWDRRLGTKSLKAKRPVCLFLCLLTMVGVLALLLLAVVPQLWRSVLGLWERIPTYIERIQHVWSVLSEKLAAFSVSLPPLSLDSESVREAIASYWERYGHVLLNFSVNLTKTVFSIVWNGVISIALAIYVLAQKEKLREGIRKLCFAFGSSRFTDGFFDFCRIVEAAFSKFIIGQLTEAVILGGLCFAGMLLFRFPYAALISVLIGISALIPIFGAFIGTGIGACLILLEEPIQAVWFVVFILVLQQIEGNVIYPRVVGKSVGLPGVWVLIAVTVGSSFGILGMLLAVPLFSVVYTLLKRFCQVRGEALSESKTEENA